MKKIFGITVVAYMVFTMVGCSATPSDTTSSSAQLSSSEPSSLEDSASAAPSFPQADEALVHDILVTFGAEETDDGTLIPQPTSLYYTESLDADNLSPKDVFSWYMGYVQNQGLTQEEKEAYYKNPIGDGMGWFFPARYYEPVTMSYFGVNEEFLHDELYYNEEHDGYTTDGGGGVGHRPEITAVSWTQSEDILTIELLFPEMHRENTEMQLTVKLLSEDLHTFISYLPSAN